MQTYFECSVPLNTVDREILRDIDRQELKLCGSKPYYNKNREIALDTELISMRYADIEHEGEKDYIPWRRYESIIRRDLDVTFRRGTGKLRSLQIFHMKRELMVAMTPMMLNLCKSRLKKTSAYEK